MEDIWGLLFYIAILVLGGLASAYRNKKKRKMAVTARPKPQKQPVFEKIPEPVFDPFKEFAKEYGILVEKPLENTEAAPEVILPSEVASLETAIETLSEEGIAAFEETREILQSDYFLDDNLISRNEISDMDAGDIIEKEIDLDLAANIRQGIIYSEILKRKHF